MKIDRLHFVKIFNYLLWPARCEVCGEYIGEDGNIFCRHCWQRLAAVTSCDYCPYCGRAASKYAIVNESCPQCELEKSNIDRIVRIGRYADVLRDIILAIKHRENPKLTAILAYQLYCAVSSGLPIAEIDIFVPIPLHWRRKLLRGYNQTNLLSAEFTANGGVVGDILKRIRNTHPQPGLTFQQRKKNVKGAFKCCSKAIAGKTICLIDDIKTTGATLDECAKVLKENGAKKVYAAVVAVAAGQ